MAPAPRPKSPRIPVWPATGSCAPGVSRRRAPPAAKRPNVMRFQSGRMPAASAPPAVPIQRRPARPRQQPPRQPPMLATHATCSRTGRGTGARDTAPAASTSAAATSSRATLFARLASRTPP